MRIFLLIIYCVFTCAASHAKSKKFEIDSLSVLPEFNQAFLLKNSQQDSYYGVLDCQSFFQKLDFYDQQDNMIVENYITINECIHFYQITVTCLKKQEPKCFDMSDIFSEKCACDS